MLSERHQQILAIMEAGIEYSTEQVAEKIGLEHLLIETDCPYLTPHPYRGSLNEPANVVYIAQEIAKLKNMEIEDVARITTFNAKRMFGIK